MQNSKRKYFKGYINIGPKLIEKIVISFDDDSRIRIDSFNSVFEGISYEDEEKAFLITESYTKEPFDEFI